MIDIEGMPIGFKCPKCRYVNKITLQDVKLGRRIICRGCKGTIVLIDKDSSVKKTSRVIQRRINEIMRELKRISYVKLKL